MPITGRADQITAAAQHFVHPGPARTALEAALTASGWSSPMAAWILRATLTPLSDPAALRAWAASAGADGSYPGTTLVVAGGAVPDPAVRSLAAAVLLGGPVILKPATAEPVLAPAFARALAAAGLDVTVAEATPHGSDAERRLFAAATRIVAFGRAASLAAVASMAPPGARVLAHGPRLSVGLVEDAEDDAGLAGLALDIARYDQRGCLSPQVVFVRGGDAERELVIHKLGRELAELARSLPCGRGAFADEVAWRLRLDSVRLGAVQARRSAPLHTDGASYLVHAARGDELELSPGGRVVAVYAAADLREAAPSVLGAAAGQVQGVAVAGATPEAWEGFLGAAYVAPAGRLQTPPLSFAPDGISPFAR